MKQFLLIFFAVIFSVLCCAFFLWWENNALTITPIIYRNQKVPPPFDNFRIAHISDLQNKSFGEGGWRLLHKLSSCSPDIIVITGDLIDRNRTDIPAAMDFINGAVKIAPVYYVPGNHEASSGVYGKLKILLLDAGVTVLDDRAVTVEQEGAKIRLAGISDPKFLDSRQFEQRLSRLISSPDQLQILLSHRPERFPAYVRAKVDLVFTGHAHGGQIRLPGIGGLYAPDQGILPHYTSGAYYENQTTEIVSRGLGNSTFPFRIFNRPEIVLVTLRSTAE